MTPQDVQNTALQGQAYIDLSVDLGDGVWVAFGDTWLFELGQGQLENLRNMRKSRLEHFGAGSESLNERRTGPIDRIHPT